MMEVKPSYIIMIADALEHQKKGNLSKDAVINTVDIGANSPYAKGFDHFLRTSAPTIMNFDSYGCSTEQMFYICSRWLRTRTDASFSDLVSAYNKAWEYFVTMNMLKNDQNTTAYKKILDAYIKIKLRN